MRTIQLSSNRKFASVEFHTKELMELFCTEPLQIGNHFIRFRPDAKFVKPKQKHQLLNISFLNVPTEAPDEALTELLEQYADIQGKPFYPQKDYQGIPYNTGTRVYQVSKLYQHIPRYIQNTFGRTVKCIYDKQQDYDRVIQFDDSDTEQDNTTHNKRKRNQANKENNKSNNNESNTIHQNQNQNDEIENETKYQNDETESETESNNELTEENPTPKQQNEKEHTQEKQNNKTTGDMQQQTKQNKTTNNNQNITTRKTNTKTQNHEYTIINPPPEINFENYPNLIPPTNNTADIKTIQVGDDTTVIPETQIQAIIPETQFDEINNANENIAQLSLLSPTLVTSNRFNLLQSTPDPLNSSTPEFNNRKDQQQQTTKPTPQTEQQNEAKKFARKLLTQEFIDTGYLDNATSGEKGEVIALSIYNMLGPYDPSNSYVQNYGHRKVIEI